MKTLAIIIPTTLDANSKRLEVLIDSLNESLKLSLLRHEITVTIILNGQESKNLSDDAPGTSNGRCLPIQVFHVANEGLVHARHGGVLKNQRADWYCFIDDDVSVCRSYIEGLQEVMESDCDLATGSILPKWELPPKSWLLSIYKHAKPWPNIPALTIQDIPSDVTEINPYFVWGANFVVSRRLLLAAKGFHPDAFPRNKILLRGDGETHIAKIAIAKNIKAYAHRKLEVNHIVPAERMEVPYFYRRTALEGVSASYNEVRSGIVHNNMSVSLEQARKLPSFEDFWLRNYDSQLNHSFTNEGWSEAAFRSAFNVGFFWHHATALNNRVLKAWCMQESYFEDLIISRLV